MLLTLSLLLVACQEEGVTVQSNDSQASKRVDQSFIKKVEVNFDAGIQAKRGGKSNNDPVLDLMIQINGAIASQGIMLERVEIMGAEEAGRTVFFDDKAT